MDLLKIRSISREIKKYIEELQSSGSLEGFYLPISKPNHLVTCIRELYQATFLKEEGRQSKFRVFLGDLSNIEISPNLFLEKDFDFKRNYIDISKQKLKFSSIEIAKISPLADPADITIFVSPEKSKLIIQGFLYCHFPKPKIKVDIAYYPSQVVDKIKFKGFVFESYGAGSLRLRCFDPICQINNGQIHFADYGSFLDPFYNRNPVYENMQCFFRNSFDDRKLTENFVYDVILAGLQLINKAKTGGTVIFISNKMFDDFKNERIIDVNSEFDFSFGDADYHDFNELDYWKKRIADTIFRLASVDGAMIVTESGIKSYGVKINFEKRELPEDLKLKGTRHQSAFYLADKAKELAFVFVVSADGGITYFSKEDSEVKLLYSNGFRFFNNKNDLETKDFPLTYVIK